MRGYLIDTNVISELTKARPNRGAVEWVANVREGYVSVLTLGEIIRGATLKRLRHGSAADRIPAWIDRVEREYAGRILAVDRAVVGRWAALPVTRTLPVIDSLLAATALAHDLVVATRNTRDFEDLGVETLDPFA